MPTLTHQTNQRAQFARAEQIRTLPNTDNRFFSTTSPKPAEET